MNHTPLDLPAVYVCPHCGYSEVGTVHITPEDLPAIAQYLGVRFAPDSPPDRPPTGPGSPTVARPPVNASSEHPAPLRLATPPEMRRAAAKAKPGRAHTPSYSRASAEQKVRAVWRPGMSVSQVERAAGVSRSTAHKWRRVLESEHVVRSQQAQGGVAL